MPTRKPGGAAARIFPIWEDAIADGLIRFENGGSMQGSRLVLTAQGRARLNGG